MFARRALRLPVQAQRRHASSSAARGADGIVVPMEGQSEFITKRAATTEHAHESSELWRKISLYVALPGCLLGGLWTKNLEEAHEAHHHHIVEQNGGEEPEKIPYPYLRKLEKKFPWGDGEKPLFNTLLGQD
ncbi:hypothetical protein E3Q17_00652 [Wallemia mellicola]|uniref:Mitochondrial cytochrome c oxidase subunit VIa n=1 Tax=Wallemia mellicola TaxID=1708541 RepID=A0A4T0P979_9BASI|nr:hypothetical protein E3Q24_00286 [Wallemia mellicola]TIB82293.1 hypothetical protein E3Q21_03442 [Wallemia mellicola]TIB85104.1 hypothetical protein E3Q20_03397 [Wallemia mellicola]TIC03988.1 hypothetical protein E3Q17_00652 [Wallemia mellicola]TIC06876.1 hypothetical protein E3Q16_00894 [Wallemia mellicola]